MPIIGDGTMDPRFPKGTKVLLTRGVQLTCEREHGTAQELRLKRNTVATVESEQDRQNGWDGLPMTQVSVEFGPFEVRLVVYTSSLMPANKEAEADPNKQ